MRQMMRFPKKGLLLVSAGFLLLLSVAACTFGGSKTEVRESSFQVRESPRLVIRNRNGHITVKSSTDLRTVEVIATLSNPDRVEYRAEQMGNTVEVTVKVHSGFRLFGKSGGANIEVSVPENIDLDLKSDNGRIAAENITGLVSTETSNGRITLDGITGSASAMTSNGKIEIGRSRGELKAQTSNGAIDFEGALSPGSDNRLRTSNGQVNVTLVDTLGVELDANTSNGTVSSALPITTSGAINEKHLIGTIGNGESTLEIRTSNGSITIQ